MENNEISADRDLSISNSVNDTYKTYKETAEGISKQYGAPLDSFNEKDFPPVFKIPFFKAFNLLIKENRKREEELSLFIDWHDKMFRRYDNRCKAITVFKSIFSYSETKDLLDFPQCMNRLIWEFCECKAKCVARIKKSVSNKNTCSPLGFDIKEGPVYNNCNYLRRRYRYIKPEKYPESAFHVKRHPINELLSACRSASPDRHVMQCVSDELNIKCDKGRPCRDLELKPYSCDSDLLTAKAEHDERIFYSPVHLYYQDKEDIAPEIKDLIGIMSRQSLPLEVSAMEGLPITLENDDQVMTNTSLSIIVSLSFITSVLCYFIVKRKSSLLCLGIPITLFLCIVIGVIFLGL